MKSRRDWSLLKVNQPDDYQQLTQTEKTILAEWIEINMVPMKSYRSQSSYFLKHRFEESVKGFYVTNGQFKGAMVAAGYRMIKPDSRINCVFNAKLKTNKPGKL